MTLVNIYGTIANREEYDGWIVNADMAELADALDLGSSGRPCRFESCYPQYKSAYNRHSFYVCVSNSLYRNYRIFFMPYCF